MNETPLLAISLDLDDTLWPAKPVLRLAEQTLSDWLAAHAPRTAAWLTPGARLALRTQVLAEHPERRHDVSFVRLETLRRALDAAGDGPALATPAFEVFLTARQKVELYADVEPVLARWSRKYRLVALSNGNADVERIGLGKYFAACVSAHELDFAKPDPRIFQEACRRVAVEPARVLHVGDDLDLDVLAAQRAGLRAAWIRRPDLDKPMVPAVHPGLPRHTAAAEEQVPPSFDSLAALDAYLENEKAG